MVDFLSNDFDEIEKYFINNIENIELLDIIKIDKSNFNKLDMLILAKYGYRNKDYVKRFLPLILSFNNLADITDIAIGTIIKFPDLTSLLNNLEILDVFITDISPGVNTLKHNRLHVGKVANNTIALPKLNISLPKVNYDDDSGILTY